MSRPFIAFYPGDYQRKTQHLTTLGHGAYFLLLMHCWTHGSIPIESEAKAAIARLPLSQWKKIAPIIDPFFDEQGRNKRATIEIEKAERISLQRAISGRKGGYNSGVSKSVAKGQQMLSTAAANAKRSPQQKNGFSEAIQNHSLMPSESDAARACPVPRDQPQHSPLVATLLGRSRPTNGSGQ